MNVELRPENYDDAIDLALATYRQRSSNSVEERVTFLELQPDTPSYTLPKEIVEVRQIFRQGTTGTASGVGAMFEPFGAAFTSQMALGMTGGQADLVTYELSTGYREMIGTMFGAHIIFSWNPEIRKLDIVRNVRAPETVLLWIYAYKSENYLLDEASVYARPWIRRYALAYCKTVLGEARSKFGSFAGPQGGTSMNGDALLSQGQAEMEALLLELQNGVEQNMGYGFVIG